MYFHTLPSFSGCTRYDSSSHSILKDRLPLHFHSTFPSTLFTRLRCHHHIFPLFGLPKTSDSSVPRISGFPNLFLLVINSSLFWRSQIISFNQIFQRFLWVCHLRVYAILNILFCDPLRDLLLNWSRIWLFCQLHNMHLVVCSRVFGHFLPFCTRPLRKYSF